MLFKLGSVIIRLGKNSERERAREREGEREGGREGENNVYDGLESGIPL